MKNLVRFFLFLVILFIFASVFSILSNKAFAQQYVEKQNESNPQYFKNAGFESYVAGWTTAAGTRTYPTGSGDKIQGQGFKLAFTSIAAEATLLSQTYSDCADLDGKNLLAGIHIKTPSANIQVCSQVDGTDQQCVAVASGGTKLEWTPVTMIAGPYTCGMRVKVVNSTTSSDITVDAARLEENRGVGEVVGKIESTYTPVMTTTSGTPTNYTVAANYEVDGGQVTIQGKLTFTGSPGTWSELFMGLPTEFPLDSTNTPAATVIGESRYRVGSGTVYHGTVFAASTSTRVELRLSAIDTHTGTPGIKTYYNVTSTSPPTWASGDYITFTFTYRTTNALTSNIVEYPAANILGTVFIEPKSSTCRPGSVKLDGSTLSGPQYSALIARLGTSTLPNWNALTPRGTGTQSINGRTKTGPTNPGDKQEDQMQEHAHQGWGSGAATGASLGAFYRGDLASVGQQGAQGTGPASYTSGANGTPRTGSETRGNSVGVTWCMWYVSQASQLVRQSVVAGDNTTGVTIVNKVREITASTYTATTDDETIKLNTASNAITLSLPPAAAVKGKKYHLTVTSDSNGVTVDPDSSETVCGNSTIRMSGNKDSITIQSDGTNWIGIGEKSCRKTVGANFGGATFITNACSSSPCALDGAFGISSVTRSTTGTYSTTFPTGTFSAKPHCNCNCVGASNETRFTCAPSHGTASTGISAFSIVSGTVAADASCSFSCTGPR